MQLLHLSPWATHHGYLIYKWGNLLRGYLGYITCQPRRSEPLYSKPVLTCISMLPSRHLSALCKFFPHGGDAGVVLFFFSFRTRLTYSSHLTFVKVPLSIFSSMLFHLCGDSHPGQSVTLWPNSVCYTGHCAPSTLELHLISGCRFLIPLWFFSQC